MHPRQSPQSSTLVIDRQFLIFGYTQAIDITCISLIIAVASKSPKQFRHSDGDMVKGLRETVFETLDCCHQFTSKIRQRIAKFS